MKKNRGNLTSYSNIRNNVTIGSGHNISVIDNVNALLGNPNYNLNLNNSLNAPKLILKNILFR